MSSKRKIPLINGEIYHIFNRSVQKLPILKNSRDCDLFLNCITYYIQSQPPIKFSHYRKMKDRFPINLNKILVKVLNYCIMPTHFHLTLQQVEDNGVETFINRIASSYAHFYNVKYGNHGHVFESRFKAVLVENNEQLIHLSRYIHLNPVTSYITNKPEGYPYSSYNIYINKQPPLFVDSSPVIDQFRNVEKYKQFVLSQTEYQRKLHIISHLLLD